MNCFAPLSSVRKTAPCMWCNGCWITKKFIFVTEICLRLQDRKYKTMKLDDSFYVREDVVQISRELLGKVLVTRLGNKITSGIITETEAYNGAVDKASHAYNNRRTPSTEIMYGRGGTAYV